MTKRAKRIQQIIALVAVMVALIAGIWEWRSLGLLGKHYQQLHDDIQAAENPEDAFEEAYCTLTVDEGVRLKYPGIIFRERWGEILLLAALTGSFLTGLFGGRRRLLRLMVILAVLGCSIYNWLFVWAWWDVVIGMTITGFIVIPLVGLGLMNLGAKLHKHLVQTKSVS